MCNVFVSVSGRIYAQGQQHDPVLLWKLDRDDAVVQRRSEIGAAQSVTSFSNS